MPATLESHRLRERRHRRVRKKIFGTAERPRLVVFRSNRGITAQLVDDLEGKTLASASWQSLKKSFKGNKTAQAAEVGKLLAENAKKADVETVVFDRGGYLYHGRVKALAEAADDPVGDRRSVLRNGEDVLLRVVDGLRNRERHLTRLAVAEADLVDLVADHDERREREPAAALDDLGDAVDLDHALLELARLVFQVALDLALN